MSANRGRGNKSTELRMQQLLESSGISGWRTNAKDIEGKPDFVFDAIKLIVFVDGCFWHGCPTCRNIPETNHDFWENKIMKTVERDKRITLSLVDQNWTVLRIWEHELKKQPDECVTKIIHLTRKLDEK